MNSYIERLKSNKGRIQEGETFSEQKAKLALDKLLKRILTMIIKEINEDDSLGGEMGDEIFEYLEKILPGLDDDSDTFWGIYDAIMNSIPKFIKLDTDSIYNKVRNKLIKAEKEIKP